MSVQCYQKNGNVYYRLDKKYHNDGDNPAIIYANGEKEWWQYGKRHRVGGPAIRYWDCLEWYENGKRHCVDGPARMWTNGDVEYWVNGKMHREDGPAVEGGDGYKEWWINGKLVDVYDPKDE